MKKSIFIFAALFAATFANAQITKILTLQGTYYPYIYAGYQQGIVGNTYNSAVGTQYFNGSFKQNQYMDYSFQSLFDNCFIYELVMDNSNTLTIKKYDESYELIKNEIVARNIPQFTDYTVSSYSIYSKLFNDNDDYEVLVCYSLTEYNSLIRNFQNKLVLIDKSGNVLCDFGTAYSITTQNCLVSYNNKWFYPIIKYNFNADNTIEYTTEIYQINKQSIQGLSQVSSTHMPAYPNPAISEINIPTPKEQGVRIYDMNGRLVDSRNGNGDVVNVNVSGYPSGNYIYQTQGNSGVFIKQ